MLSLLLCAAGLAAPVQLTYQGRALDSDGSPINGSQTIVVTIENEAATEQHTETFTNQSISDGYFSVQLGSNNNLDHTELAGDRFVAVTVGNSVLPRQALTEVPSAAHATAATYADESASVSAASSAPDSCSGDADRGRTWFDTSSNQLKVCFGTDGWRPMERDGVYTNQDYSLAWGALHAAAAAACRGSTASGGTGCCGNIVKVRNTSSGQTCNQICQSSSGYVCDAEVSVWGSAGKATSNGQQVGSFYNYGCGGSGNGGSEATAGNAAVLTSGYWSYCCCRRN